MILQRRDVNCNIFALSEALVNVGRVCFAAFLILICLIKLLAQLSITATMDNKNIYVIALLLSTAGLFVWWGLRGGEKRSRGPVGGNVFSTNAPRHGKASSRSVQEFSDGEAGLGEEGEARIGKALSFPPVVVKELPVDAENADVPARAISSDDAILAAGGLGEVKAKAPEVSEELRKKRLKSIVAKDWGESANLLVNELRAGRGFEVPLENVEAFLRGKDLFGWPEGRRNWIGDEMMTMLRQEVPQKAYELFSTIQADGTAPEAMRDYSIQHISHLIADGQVGQEGADLIRAAYESGNTVLASTSLISLYRLSEKSPEFVKADDVKRYAQDSVNSTDERLKATAQAILKD